MAAVGHFGCSKITFDLISIHFTSIRNFFFLKLLTKWLTSPILDDRISLSIAFLAISDRSAILDFRNSLSIAILAISDRYRFFFGGHFGCLKITLDRISGHFRLIGHLGCPKFKMAAGGHFGCPQITFDCISGHFRSTRNLFIFEFC